MIQQVRRARRVTRARRAMRVAISALIATAGLVVAAPSTSPVSAASEGCTRLNDASLDGLYVGGSSPVGPIGAGDRINIGVRRPDGATWSSDIVMIFGDEEQIGTFNAQYRFIFPEPVDFVRWYVRSGDEAIWDISCTPWEELDPDGDGVPNASDNCPRVSNPFQADYDGDGIGDACDPDGDNDGVPFTEDNCWLLPNPDQADLDGDGMGDLCDSDIDGDAVPNASDEFPRDATRAVSCPIGFYGGFSCEPAPAGTYVGAPGALEPTPCEPGSYQPGIGQFECLLAPPGTFVADSGATSATPCEPGSFAPARGLTECELAPRGYHVPKSGSLAATPCAPGTYSGVVGAIACTPAPAGSFVDQEGASEATLCPVGRFSSVEGSVSCEPAPIGSYVDQVGATSATACPSGYSTIAIGSTSADDCLPDFDGDSIPDVVDPDDDNDGVDDVDDVCAESVLGDADAAPEAKKNRYWAGVDGNFVDIDGAWSGYTVVDTGGCTATQIIAAAGLGGGHERFGLTKSSLTDWIESI